MTRRIVAAPASFILRLPRLGGLSMTRAALRSLFAPLLLLMAFSCGGCVQRTLQSESNPPGALVYLNGEEVGRTPMRKNFLWYGTYDVELRKEGYQTMTRQTQVWAPWWQVPPLDLLAELLPLEDKQYADYRLRPTAEVQTDPEQILARAAKMRKRLRSSQYTRAAKTRQENPATQPTQ